MQKIRSPKWLRLATLAAILARAPAHVLAHGGVDDEPTASTTVSVPSSATQTDFEVLLEDLNQSATGASAPLVRAKVRGF